MKRRISLRGVVFSILGVALLGGLVYLIVHIVSTDWRTYNIDEVENLFDFYYNEEDFVKDDRGIEALTDVGIVIGNATNSNRKVLVMKNFDLSSPTMTEDNIADGRRYRYMLLETGLSSKDAAADYEAAMLNVENMRDYYMENEEENKTAKVLYENAVVGHGRDYVYVFIGDEAELMKREMEMLLK